MSVPSFVLVQGAITGLGYGLLAMGLVLIYRTNRVLNFAQGQLGVVAAVFLVKCFYDFGFNYWFSLVLAVGLAAAIGALSELVLRRLFNRPRVLVMVATIGLSQVLFVLTALPFLRPKNLFKPFPVPVHLTFHIGTYLFTPGQVLTLIVAPIVAVALAALVKWSRWGLNMRAMAENAESARLSGVWVRRTSTVSWTLAGVLSAFAAILASPGQASALTDLLSPELLLLALTAAMVGAMVSLSVAFIAAIVVGVVQEILVWNLATTAQVDLVLFLIVSVVLLVRIAALPIGGRREEQSSWLESTRSRLRDVDPLRRRVGGTGVALVVLAAALAPLVVSTGRSFLMSQICIYAVIALSLTVLTGWAGQVSLGQFGLVAIGALMASHLGSSVPLILLLPFAGAVTAVVAVVIGLPALRVRGLYLAVSTLAFSLWLMGPILATTCWTVPVLDKRLCTGLPNPQSTLIARPSIFGIDLGSERAFAWFSLVVLVLSASDGPAVARPRGRASADLGPGQRVGGGCDGHSAGAHQAVGLRTVGVHRRLRRGVPGLRARALLDHHLRPDLLAARRLDGGHRRPRLDRGRGAGGALSGRDPGDLRHHADHPVPHQRARAPRLHPLSPRRPGRGHAPTR